MVEVIEAADKSLRDSGGHMPIHADDAAAAAADTATQWRRPRAADRGGGEELTWPIAIYHPAALVETDDIGAGTRVWAFAHVMRGARVGSNCNVGDHAFVEAGAVVGNNVTLKNNVCVWAGVTLEDDVFVGPNATFTNDRYPRSPRMPEAAARYETPERWLSPHRRRARRIDRRERDDRAGRSAGSVQHDRGRGIGYGRRAAVCADGRRAGPAWSATFAAVVRNCWVVIARLRATPAAKRRRCDVTNRNWKQSPYDDPLC